LYKKVRQELNANRIHMPNQIQLIRPIRKDLEVETDKIKKLLKSIQNKEYDKILLLAKEIEKTKNILNKARKTLASIS